MCLSFALFDEACHVCKNIAMKFPFRPALYGAMVFAALMMLLTWELPHSPAHPIPLAYGASLELQETFTTNGLSRILLIWALLTCVFVYTNLPMANGWVM